MAQVLELTKGKQSIVCDCHFDRVGAYRWCYANAGYAVRAVRKPRAEMFYLHRVIAGIPPGREVDHINGDKLDNRCDNLRPVTRGQNMANTKIRSTNTSGHKGVHWSKRDHRWVASITVNYRNIGLGYFKDKSEAVKARKAAELKYFGEFAWPAS